jgi:hypothetical protein
MTTNDTAGAEQKLLVQTSHLRDELQTTLIKLEMYADALMAEVTRLKQITEQRTEEREK